MGGPIGLVVKVAAAASMIFLAREDNRKSVFKAGKSLSDKMLHAMEKASIGDGGPSTTRLKQQLHDARVKQQLRDAPTTTETDGA